MTKITKTQEVIEKIQEYTLEEYAFETTDMR